MAIIIIIIVANFRYHHRQYITTDHQTQRFPRIVCKLQINVHDPANSTDLLIFHAVILSVAPN